MDNLLTNCLEFLADTYGNRPHNADGIIRPYTESERGTLKGIVTNQMERVKEHKNEIPQANYELIRTIYEFVLTQLDNKQI